MGKKLAVVGSDNLYHLGAKGYLTVDGVHKSVKKMYLTQGGVHRLVFGGGIDIATMVITYSADGGMQDAGVVTMGDGKQYRLLTLTKSGTLTVPEEVQAEIWMCGGGANGQTAYRQSSNNFPISGLGGAGAYTATGTMTLSSSTVAVIGSGGGGASSFGSIQTAAMGKTDYNGGTGGGGKGTGGYGNGDGIDKHPFSDATYFPDAHCGGGGGGYLSTGSALSQQLYGGGNGGTNGGNGNAGKRDNVGSGGIGGEVGGGTGAGITTSPSGAGYAATFYGSGGGGGGFTDFSDTAGKGGAGYQGIIYIRIPVNQAA